ncbi:hypothetical protein GQ44DRAFT_695935, partial [Phaeosphaeriaceae sp. PMI808]
MSECADGEADVFKNAIKAFDDSFTEQEKAEYFSFKSIDEMFESVQKNAAQHSTLREGPIQRFSQGVQRLNNSLEPYFMVITTCIQADPRVAGLVWGSLLLIFRVRIHHSRCA